jgi:hypothetical protein
MMYVLVVWFAISFFWLLYLRMENKSLREEITRANLEIKDVRSFLFETASKGREDIKRYRQGHLKQFGSHTKLLRELGKIQEGLEVVVEGIVTLNTELEAFSTNNGPSDTKKEA